MNKRRRQRGFTMAEMLVVAAIIAVLSGVAFIAVQRYQRSMAQLERDAIAKEIFVAAQNHLTMAEGQNFLNVTNFGDERVGADGNATYIFASNRGDGFSATPSLLDLMLPFGSVDETVRAGGNFLIRYQKKPAAVLDVFYSAGPGGRYSHSFGTGETSALEEYKGLGNTKRRDYGGSVIGWYGGEATPETGAELNPPRIEVKNEERLWVRVTNTNTTNGDARLKLIIEGKESGAMAAFSMDKWGDRITRPGEDLSSYDVVLDDITDENLHFTKLNDPVISFFIDRQGEFLPGENISIRAVAYSNSSLTNIAYSGEVTTNSLFADTVPAEGEGATGNVARIANFRHLENLGSAVSEVAAGEDRLNITAAAQLEDLNWDDFTTAIESAKGVTKVKVVDSDGVASAENCYLPAFPEYAVAYDGQGHWINGVRVQSVGSANAGLFASTSAGSKISNLLLTNFDISADSGSAGALAGALKDTTVENVVAYYGDVPVAEGEEAPAKPGTEGRIASASGSAGGLAGTVNGGSLSRSAAALYVSGGNAGGLAGTSNGAALTACYSGGHTKEGKYEDAANVTATGSAGGLVGSLSGGSVTGCYSTCSASGATAGGLAGTASGATLNSCYATGRVTGSEAEGAFAGALSGDVSDCLYLEIVNERTVSDGEGTAIRCLPAVGGADATGGITAADADAKAYSTFLGSPDGWAQAAPYDLPMLANDYSIDGESRYPLESLARLNAADTLQEGDLVSTHYGDWPVPELFVLN